jgi:DivIVA domain-containing protein
VARCAATLDGTAADPVTDRDVLTAHFPATKFREGYDQDRVDDLLDQVVLALRAQSGGHAGTRA